jgi:hypothetical protein
MKQAAIRRSRKRILVSHAAKWNKPAAVTFAPWDQFTVLVTDAVPTAAEKSALRRHGVTLRLVSAG